MEKDSKNNKKSPVPECSPEIQNAPSAAQSPVTCHVMMFQSVTGCIYYSGPTDYNGAEKFLLPSDTVTTITSWYNVPVVMLV